MIREFALPEVEDTDKLVPLAVAGCEGHSTCFWLRGIVPAGTLQRVHLDRVTLRGVGDALLTHAGGWSGGTLFTDGSGGSFGSDPDVRRCGMGIAWLRGDYSLAGGAFAPIPGHRQTVPRAELWAVVVVAGMVRVGAHVTIVTDASVVASGISKKALWWRQLGLVVVAVGVCSS